MKNQQKLLLGLVAGVAVLSLTLGVEGSSAPAEAAANSDFVRVVEAHPFELDQPAIHTYRAEQPAYDRGWLLVLDADPVLLVPRQTFEPVLYVGAETAERLNVGDTSGRLVVIVPDPERTLDLAAEPVFFGNPELPERITRPHAVAERAAATARGLAGQDVELREPARFADAYELKRFAADLIESHSPEELDVISGLRATRLTR